ncbi:MAG: S1 RNA-binding domain-containing protein [Planctomycetota bacterium]
MTEFSPESAWPTDAALNDSPSAPSPSMAEIDREVAEAMSAMAPGDLAELGGGVGGGEVAAGTELTGTVTGVTDDDVFVQFGVKSQGVLPRNQFGKKEVVNVGRRVDVVVERFDADSGLVIVSRKGALQRATWTNLTKGMIVEGKVTGVIKGGLEIDLKGIRAFMPGSHADIVPMKDVSLLLNQMVRCEVLELDRRNKNVLLSRRKVQERELAEAREKLRAELAVGQVRPGVVRSITDFGAFVDLGGVDGLLHIRELSWGTVEKVTDVLSAGQRVEVMILKIDSKRERISLGLKQALPDPWVHVPEKYPVGTPLKVRVIRLADFGAFAELEPGVEGLIPISEMGWSRVKQSADVVSSGSVVDCVVIRVEAEKHRIALSMKQAQPDPWAGVFEGFPVHSLVHGKVTRLADFGVFVEIAPGVEGLVHISELSDHRVKSCSEVVQPGQEVETRVLGVDKDNHRISLSIKAVNAPTSAEAAAAAGPAAPAKTAKKRKKPLRGGLSSHFEW